MLRSITERQEAMIGAIATFCAHQDHMETSERKMCYYLEPLLQTTAQALLNNMRTDRICKKLAKENPDVCLLVTVTETSKAERQAMSNKKR